MTLEEIRMLDREFLTPAQIAPLLGVDPQDVRVAAKQCPERLGFNVSVIGSRVKIPRLAFIEFMCGSNDACHRQKHKEGHGRCRTA